MTCPCHCSRPGHPSPASFGCRRFHASAHPHRWSLGSWVCALLGLPTYNLCLALGHGRATDYWVFSGGCAVFALDLQNYHHCCHSKHYPHLAPPSWASTGGWTCCGCSPHFQGALGSLGCCQYHTRWRAGLISGCDDHYWQWAHWATPGPSSESEGAHVRRTFHRGGAFAQSEWDLSLGCCTIEFPGVVWSHSLEGTRSGSRSCPDLNLVLNKKSFMRAWTMRTAKHILDRCFKSVIQECDTLIWLPHISCTFWCQKPVSWITLPRPKILNTKT